MYIYIYTHVYYIFEFHMHIDISMGSLHKMSPASMTSLAQATRPPYKTIIREMLCFSATRNAKNRTRARSTSCLYPFKSLIKLSPPPPPPDLS